MKKVLIIFTSLLLTLGMSLKISANDIKIIDDDNVLSDQEKQELDYLIKDYIGHTGYDMVIYLADKGEAFYTQEAHTVTELADDTFDFNGYGIGENLEGIILCFDIMYRDYTITTSGPSCINTYSIAALESIYDNVTPFFRENEFFEGCKAFINGAKFAYDNYDLYHESIPQHNVISESLIAALICSLIITIISFIVLSSKLKSTSIKNTAGEYMKDTKINILRSGDIYLYSNISRRKIERVDTKSNNNFSSPTHISSSGHSHGGGGSHKV